MFGADRHRWRPSTSLLVVCPGQFKSLMFLLCTTVTNSGIRPSPESKRIECDGLFRTQWPEGLNDEEALQRLQTLCLGACDGIQDLADDMRYKALRRALLGRTDLRPLVPAFVAAQPSLEAFVRHARETKDRMPTAGDGP
jgi:hypothetical protein